MISAPQPFGVEVPPPSNLRSISFPIELFCHPAMATDSSASDPEIKTLTDQLERIRLAINQRRGELDGLETDKISILSDLRDMARGIKRSRTSSEELVETIRKLDAASEEQEKLFKERQTKFLNELESTEELLKQRQNELDRREAEFEARTVSSAS